MMFPPEMAFFLMGGVLRGFAPAACKKAVRDVVSVRLNDAVFKALAANPCAALPIKRHSHF
jgi:hypothetical protein